MYHSNQSNLNTKNEIAGISPIDCTTLRLFSAYCFCLFFVSIIVNGSLLVVFYKYKKLRTNLNLLIIAIAVLNLIATFLYMPFVIISNYYCKYNIN